MHAGYWVNSQPQTNLMQLRSRTLKNILKFMTAESTDRSKFWRHSIVPAILLGMLIIKAAVVAVATAAMHH